MEEFNNSNERLAYIFEESGKTKSRFAVDCGINASNFIKMLNGKVGVSFDNAKKIENAYGYRVKAEDAPFAGLTTYWARHTWATIAAGLDIPKEVIARCLTHSWGQTVTDTYIDFDWRKVDEAVKKVVELVNKT